MRHLLLSGLLISCCSHLFSQVPEKIRFSKASHPVYFFQIGDKSDTIVKNKSDLFYFIVPDTLKGKIAVLCEHAKLQSTLNDSIVKVDHVPGLKYESLFVNEGPENALFLFKTFVNGTAVTPRGRLILQVVNKRTGEMLINNMFYYSE